MLSKWNWIIFNLIAYASAVLGSETKAFLDLLELDYEDACYETADVQWSFIISSSNETLSAWEAQQYKYAEFKKTTKTEVLNITAHNTNEQLKPFLQYKYDVIKKPGDELLKDEDWKKLVYFAGTVELKRSIINYVNKSHNYSRDDVEYLLSHSKNPSDMQIAWNRWYHELKPLVKNYSNNLLLAEKAAKENDAESIEKYWAMMSGYPNGYNKIENEWKKISTLNKKILKFISINLSQKYGIAINDSIPAYLLGSLQGYDWTDLSSDILPYPDLIYDIKKNLWKKKYLGESLYKTASSLGWILLKHVPQAEFWEKSEFNQQCPSRLLNFCKDGIMRVSACPKATVSNFLEAHKDVGKILFNQVTFESTPVLNTANRYSGLEEGISGLFGILSASPAWLNHTYLMNATNDNEQRSIVSLMITALNTLPQLAYYYSADMWRINAIKHNITDPKELVSSWWKYRQEYEGISSETDSPTFLDDSYIIRNKPYLPKILGMMLAFQLYEYNAESTEVRYDVIDRKFMNGNIIKMIQNGGADDWQDIINKFVDIDDISAYALISYFSPLEDFLDENEELTEENEETYKPRLEEDKELEELEKHILQEINTPTTTPPPTTTMKITTAIPKTMSNANQLQPKKDKPSESKSTVHIQKDMPESPDSSRLNLPTEVPINKSLAVNTLDETKDNKPKINTSKAVWVVSAILVAIITICIIAIFGRRRCRKAPKNRRTINKVV